MVPHAQYSLHHIIQHCSKSEFFSSKKTVTKDVLQSNQILSSIGSVIGRQNLNKINSNFLEDLIVWRCPSRKFSPRKRLKETGFSLTSPPPLGGAAVGQHPIPPWSSPSSLTSSNIPFFYPRGSGKLDMLFFRSVDSDFLWTVVMYFQICIWAWRNSWSR